MLAADAFWQFGDTRDRTTAVEMFARLQSQYPTSSLIARIADQMARLNGDQADAGGLTTLTAIRREVLPDALRITLELEREATFYEERLDGPPRVFVDLRNTQAVDALRDATIPFQGDVVRRARVGRHADNRTRVVFDLQGAGRYSVYSLYNPYRVVIRFRATRPGRPTDAAGRVRHGAGARGLGNHRPGKQPVPTRAPSEPDAPPPTTAIANAAGGFSLSRQLGLGIARIVIDPGHGGRDPGAKVRGLNEAELVLDIAIRLERLLAAEPGVEVVMTRRSNAYVALEERTAIANPVRRRPLPLDSRQFQQRRERARLCDLLPQLRTEPRGRGTGGARERRVGAHDGQSAGHRGSHRPQQQDRRVTRFRLHGPGLHAGNGSGGPSAPLATWA